MKSTDLEKNIGSWSLFPLLEIYPQPGFSYAVLVEAAEVGLKGLQILACIPHIMAVGELQPPP